MIVITSANLLRAIWMPNEICNARAATPAPKRDEKTLRPEPNGPVGEPVFGGGSDWRINDMIMGWAPSLAWLLPAQSPKKTAEGAVSSDVAQQIKLIAVDLASVRRNMGQLAANQDQFAAKQEQMNQSIATLQQVEQDVRQQALAPPAPKPAHPPAHNPPQPSP